MPWTTLFGRHSPPPDRESTRDDERQGLVASNVEPYQLSTALRRAALGQDEAGVRGQREAVSEAFRAFGALREHVERIGDGSGGGSADDHAGNGNAGSPTEGPSAGGRGADAAVPADNGGAALPEMPHGDIQALARWVEDAMPFLMLLLAIFLYRHLLGILAFGWLTSVLHNANDRMRKQTLLKEARSRPALALLFFMLVGHISFITAIQGWDRQTQQPSQRLLHQLQLRRVLDFDAEPPALSLLLWDILMADLVARSSLMLLKTQIAIVVPAGSTRRLRRLYAFIETVGLCYRVLMPAPLWFHCTSFGF